ncbi:MAG TPA: peptidoglycan DD-metalloendopeptidase family protein [Miltoncostaeaceae bacterium]|nr:peptidoglycan DD-metalloendopeptidase family protein [Miltoncostaeaceae bacterium]
MSSAQPRTRLLAALVAVVAAACALGAPGADPAAGAGTIAGTRTQIADLGREVALLDIRMGQAIQANNQAVDRLEAAQDLLAATRSELAGARRDLDRSRDLLAERVVALYVNDPPSFVELLLTTGSLQQAQQTGDLLDQVARGDAGVVTTVKARRARLEALEETQAGAESTRRRELAAAEDRRAAVSALRAEQEQLLADARSELKRLVKEERERQRRLKALEAARTAYLTSLPVAGGTTLAGALPQGDFLFPVAGAVQFTNDWGFARAGGRSHEGIDLFAARGTPVVAVADGTLFNVGWNGLGGWRLWVRDTAGNGFYYAHLDAYAPTAREGAAVTRGTVLGYVGDSGDAQGTPPHLHFEVHPGGGGPVPPYPIITGWPRAG